MLQNFYSQLPVSTSCDNAIDRLPALLVHNLVDRWRHTRVHNDPRFLADSSHFSPLSKVSGLSGCN